MLNYRVHLADMPSYDVTERDWRIKINANESNMNLPPAVEDRLMGRLTRVAFNRYPNEEYDALREQIAAANGCRKENILLGSGSSEIIEKLFFGFGGENHTIVYPEPSFSMYKIYAKAAEATGVAVPLNEDFTFDAKKFVAAADENHAALSVICNPNNPTGTGIDLKDIKYTADNVSGALLLDEAYMEFFDAKHSALQLLPTHKNLIVARTFSKAYGLAAVRVGYMIAEAGIVSMIEKAFMPYHLNVLSTVTADIVFQMRDEYAPRIAMAIAERKRLSDELAKLPNMRVYPSETNFVFVRYEKAAALNDYLIGKGIGIRAFGGAALQNYLRISVGQREENDEVLREIKRFTEGADL